MSSMPDPIFQRRQRRKDHYHQLDKTLLFAYPDLSDGARLTYMVLDAYDWPDASGCSKGYVFPYQSTLAKVRRVSVRTIQNHLRELIDCGLITVEVCTTQRGRRNIYWIEDCSQEEFERYLNMMSKPQLNVGDENNFVMGSEEICVTGGEEICVHKDTKDKDTNKDKDKTGLVGSGPDFSSCKTEVPIPETLIYIHRSLEEIINRNLSLSEVSHLHRLVTTYGNDDVFSTLNEVQVQRDKQPIKDPVRYMEGILENWQSEGRRTTDFVAHIRNMIRNATA